MILWLAPLSLGLDLISADPKNLPHPVQVIGRLADALETPARHCAYPVLAGAAVLAALLAMVGSTVALLTHLPFGLGIVIALYFSWAGLALGGLVREGNAALTAVNASQRDPDTLPEARQAVQMLVSRDTKDMDVSDLYRSLAESVSENFNDAFVAPYFWLCTGGPVVLWLYKTASTMDSMWGYKNERWLLLGKAAARLDDALAFIPARLSVMLMFITFRGERAIRCSFGTCVAETGSVSSLGRWPGWGTVVRQARLSSSPNAGWPMAMAAWLFHGKTGGPTTYEGQTVHKPFMGPETGKWNADNTAALLRHVRMSGIVGGVVGFLLLYTVA